MKLNNDDIKGKLFNLLGYYSKYYFKLFSECEDLYQNQSGHTALFQLFTLLENVIKTELSDFDNTFYKLIDKLKDENKINQTEYFLLNDNVKGIRKIRNILAHANLSKYDLKIEKEIKTYPFTENETCIIIYDILSEIVSAIIIKIIDPSKSLNMDSQINSLNYEFITRTPEELMTFKGIPLSDGWNQLTESHRYRLVENSFDINILTEIFKGQRE